METDSLLVVQVTSIVTNPIVVQVIVGGIVFVIAYLLGLFRVSKKTLTDILKYFIIIIETVDKVETKERFFTKTDSQLNKDFVLDKAFYEIRLRKDIKKYLWVGERLGGLREILNKLYRDNKVN